MTEIQFMVLSQGNFDDALHYCCRLTEKVFKRGERLYLHVENAEVAAKLDELLWSFRAESFLPHQLQDGDTAADILIGYGDSPGDHMDVMVNLSPEIPPFFSRFKRLAEIVCQEERYLLASRTRFKDYRDKGYPLKKVDV